LSDDDADDDDDDDEEEHGNEIEAGGAALNRLSLTLLLQRYCLGLLEQRS